MDVSTHAYTMRLVILQERPLLRVSLVRWSLNAAFGTSLIYRSIGDRFVCRVYTRATPSNSRWKRVSGIYYVCVDTCCLTTRMPGRCRGIDDVT